FPQCHSGTEQYCHATAREARRRGDTVVVLSLDPWVHRDDPPIAYRDEPFDGFPVHRLRHWEGLAPSPELLDFDNPLVTARFRTALREIAPDAVHFFHVRRLGAGLIEAAHDLGFRTVVQLMDFWFVCPRFTLLRRDGALCEGPPDGGLGCIPCEAPELQGGALEGDVATAAAAFAGALTAPVRGPGTAARLSAYVRRREELLARLGLADAVIAPSRFLAALFAQNGFAADTLHVVPYGLEPGRVRARAVERPRDPLRVGFAGVLSPWKAPHVVVDAVRRVRGRVRLTVHGRTEEAMFQDYIDDLRARAAGDARITFPGAFDRERLEAVMADLDLLVVPSLWYENTPFVVLEAFAAGVPVAVSDLGGMTEIVTPGVDGFRFPPGDVDAL